MLRITFILAIAGALLETSLAESQRSAGNRSKAEPPAAIIDTKPTIGLIGIADPSNFGMMDGVASAVHAKGLKAVSLPAVTSQQQAAATLITSKVRVLVVNPQEESGWDETLKAAKDAAIPVFVVGRPLHTERPELAPVTVLPDFHEQGVLAAKWIVKQLEGTGGVLEIRGIEGSTPSIERQAGFMSILARHRLLTQVGSIAQGDTDEILRERFADVLKKKGDRLKAIFIHDPKGARIVATMLRDSSIEHKEAIRIIAIDSGEGLTGVFSGTATGASIECEPSAAKVITQATERFLLGVAPPSTLPLRSIVIEHLKSNEPSTTVTPVP